MKIKINNKYLSLPKKHIYLNYYKKLKNKT